MKKVTIYLDDDTWKAFRMDCLQESISASKAIEIFVRHHLETKKSTHMIQKNTQEKTTHA